MTKKKKYTPFLPIGLKAFIANRLVEILGLGLICLGVGLAISLLTYSPTDSCLNVASILPSHNRGEEAGAIVADFVLQIFGYASLTLIPFSFLWGCRFVLHKRPLHAWVLVPALLLFSIALGRFSSSHGIPMGGLIGHFVKQAVHPASILSLMISGVCFFCFIILFFFGLGLTREQLKKIKEFFILEPSVPEKREASALPKEKKKEPILKKQGDYHLPPVNLMRPPPSTQKLKFNRDQLEANAQALQSVLEDFGVQGTIDDISPGPVVTLYKLKPAPGTKSSRVISLSDDIARSMSAISARIAVIPGHNAMGIELPNIERQTVYLRELLEDPHYTRTSCALPLILGKDIGGTPIIADLTRMPHLLVAGTTGSGKSVSINTMILSLLYALSPERCRFIMIDPKMLELSIYDGIPHLLTPVVTDPHKAVVALKWVVREMESRYQNMSKLNVRNIDGYNQRIQEAQANGETLRRRIQTGFDPETGNPLYEEQDLKPDPLPYIVVIVDEMADLMLVAGKDIESAVQRLAQMARAAGIHLIMATQRPSVDVITGTIKANFPTRISFQVTSKIDSRTILGEQGAEQLLGQGDMLFMAPGGRITRVHGPFVGDTEVEKAVQFLKNQADPDYIADITVEVDSGDSSLGNLSDDPLYQQALTVVRTERKASTSFIQRSLKIGYNRAATIIDQMEKEGVVSAPNHVGKREVLLP